MRRVRLLCAGEGRLIIAVLVATFVSALVTVAWPVIMGWGIDAARTHHRAALPRLELALAVVIGIRPFAEWLRVALTVEMGERALGKLRTASFARVQGLPLGALERRSTGALVSRLTADLDILTEVVGQGFSDAVFGVVVLVVALVTMVRLSPLLALAGSAGIPLLVVSIGRYLRLARPRGLAVREAVDDTFGAVQEYMAAHRIIRVAGREEAYLQHYRARSQQVVARTRPLGFASARFTASFPMAYGFGLMVMLAAGTALMTGGGLHGGTVSACALALVAVWNTASIVLGQMPIFQSAGVAFIRVMQLVELDEFLPEPSDAAEVPARGALAVRSVEFSYVPGVPVLRVDGIDIPAGQHVALVGATGAGKSALAGVMARMYDPDTGTVSLDGTDVRRFRVRDLRQRLVLVSQDARLLSGTIGDNIALVDSKTDLRRVCAALDGIGARGYFERLPHGLGTSVGEASLSAGERQLVALARLAMLDPAVIILDEATAHLEPEIERTVTSALRTLANGRTLVTIAHRLDTTRSADRVLVLDGGRVVEDGRPDALIASGGRYAALWAAWLAAS